MAKSAKKKSAGKAPSSPKQRLEKRTKADAQAAGKAADQVLRLGPEVVWGDLQELFGESSQRGWSRWPGLPDFAALVRAPAIDIIDHDRELVVRAEVPGVQKDDLEVAIAERVLTIKGASRSENEHAGDDYYRREIRSGIFSRSVLLPSDVDASKAEARFNAGVLELRLPKLRVSKRRTIPVS